MSTQKSKAYEHPAIKLLELVPTYEQAEVSAKGGDATPIEKIVFHYGGGDDHETFMTMLCDAVMETRIAKVAGERMDSILPGEFLILLDALGKVDLLLLEHHSAAIRESPYTRCSVCDKREEAEMMADVRKASERGYLVAELFTERKYALFMWDEHESGGVLSDLTFIGLLDECYSRMELTIKDRFGHQEYAIINVTSWHVVDCSDDELCDTRLLDIPSNLWRDRSKLSAELKLEESRRELEALREENRLLKEAAKVVPVEDDMNVY